MSGHGAASREFLPAGAKPEGEEKGLVDRDVLVENVRRRGLDVQRPGGPIHPDVAERDVARAAAVPDREPRSRCNEVLDQPVGAALDCDAVVRGVDMRVVDVNPIASNREAIRVPRVDPVYLSEPCGRVDGRYGQVGLLRTAARHVGVMDMHVVSMDRRGPVRCLLEADV